MEQLLILWAQNLLEALLLPSASISFLLSVFLMFVLLFFFLGITMSATIVFFLSLSTITISFWLVVTSRFIWMWKFQIIFALFILYSPWTYLLFWPLDNPPTYTQHRCSSLLFQLRGPSMPCRPYLHPSLCCYLLSLNLGSSLVW